MILPSSHVCSNIFNIIFAYLITHQQQNREEEKIVFATLTSISRFDKVSAQLLIKGDSSKNNKRRFLTSIKVETRGKFCSLKSCFVQVKSLSDQFVIWQKECERQKWTRETFYKPSEWSAIKRYKFKEKKFRILFTKFTRKAWSCK